MWVCVCVFGGDGWHQRCHGNLRCVKKKSNLSGCHSNWLLNIKSKSRFMNLQRGHTHTHTHTHKHAHTHLSLYDDM